MKKFFKTVAVVAGIGTVYCIGYASCLIDGLKIFYRLVENGKTIKVVSIDDEEVEDADD